VPVVLVLVLAGGGSAFYFLPGWKGERPDLIRHTVKRESLQLTIIERGALESADNRDVLCKVKAGSKGSTVSTTIKWVIDDGTQVRRGQLLAELDDAGLQDQLKTQKITLDQARAAWVTAEENHKIVVSQNESDIKTAEVAVEIADLNLQKYTGEGVLEPATGMTAVGLSAGPTGSLMAAAFLFGGSTGKGEYRQALDDVNGRIKLAESDLEMAIDRLAWSERMVKKGYLTATQAQADRSKLESTREALKKVQMEHYVLQNFTRRGTETDLKAKLAEALRALDRTQKQARAKEVTADSDRQSKLSIYQQEELKHRDIEDEIRKCTIVAPQEGMVVYFVPESTRFGSGSRQSTIAQGEPVVEGQKLMRIPDLTRMLVSAKVHEAMVSRVKGEDYARTGFSDSVRAALAIDPSAMSRLLALNAFSELREQYRDREHRMTFPGQRATVRVDAMSGRMLRGHVKSVATVASQADWNSSDVKLYQTMISIDEPVEGLKPGMSAEVTIYTDNQVEDALAIPVQAILGGVEMGQHRRCYVLSDVSQEPIERQIRVGLSNEKMAEVVEGLSEGEVVILNPRSLPAEKQKARQPSVTPNIPGGPTPGGLSGGPGGAPGGPGRGAGKMKGAGGAAGPGGPGGPPQGGPPQGGQPPMTP
jgi:HlyD family secretion protein